MKPLSAHSILEARLYMMLQSCAACQTGPPEVINEQLEEEHIDGVVRFDCTCKGCGRSSAARFCIDSRWLAPSEPPLINAAEEPSKLLDVSQWLTLYHTLRSRSEESPDRIAMRRWAYQAGLCVSEALKFYEPDNDLAPASAFFSDLAREQARANPTHFTRERLLAMQSKLPNLRAETVDGRPKSGGKWWKFWHKSKSDANSGMPRSD